ncbi:MAG TPA: 1-deoxy-D-xylulose-5-phosphate reductoisomerase [Candidatus Scatomorpha pullicola]|nr:1-deoxy-D-xylulose-5-phosphate reductoisomerase [Candidatus Scatomorpha pullicola]
MVKSTAILGSTGSIGRQSVAVCEHLGIRVSAMTTNRNVDLLLEQAARLKPEYVAAFDEAASAKLREALSGSGITVGAPGEEGLRAAAVWENTDCVVTAVSGAVGLRPTLDAIGAKRRIALANKETLVCAGSIVMARARETGAEIVPVDSEHSAIFQCLNGRRGELRKILLTGSGGPFRGWTRERTKDVTPERAVKHPNWSMGAKISVDSATMMNKGLEFIEAMHLFGVTPDDIEVLIHPESVVHSAVELVDGTVIAQLGVPDMSLPIQYALTWPERCESESGRLDLTAMSGLHFMKPDLERMPCLALAMDCARRGGNAPAVMSAANEVAVGMFLSGKLGYNEIYESVEYALGRIGFIAEPSLEDILSSDGEARTLVKERYS